MNIVKLKSKPQIQLPIAKGLKNFNSSSSFLQDMNWSKHRYTNDYMELQYCLASFRAHNIRIEPNISAIVFGCTTFYKAEIITIRDYILGVKTKLETYIVPLDFKGKEGDFATKKLYNSILKSETPHYYITNKDKAIDISGAKLIKLISPTDLINIVNKYYVIKDNSTGIKVEHAAEFIRYLDYLSDLISTLELMKNIEITSGATLEKNLDKLLTMKLNY